MLTPTTSTTDTNNTNHCLSRACGGTDKGEKDIRIRRVSMVEQDAMTTTTPTTTTTMPDNWLEALPCDLSRYIMELSIITTDELVEQVYESVVHESLSYTVDQEELDEIIADNETGYSIDYYCSVQNSIKDRAENEG